MIRSIFIPARSSRHRVAAIALYRALIRFGQQIPLPPDLQAMGPTHPVVHLVRKRFAKNANHTSLRLTYASMAAGYKFLSLFSKAQAKGTPQHSQILQHLRKRNETASHSRSIAPPRTQPRSYNPPLLTKISLPNAPIQYEPTTRPLPKSALSAERKIPQVVATAEGVPFLRTKKPQPRVLSKSIARKTRVYHKNIYGVVDIEEDEIDIADQEDRWEGFIRQAQRAEGKRDQIVLDNDLSTFRWSQELSKLWHRHKLDVMWQDWTARGKALQTLVDKERSLAHEEQQPSSPVPQNESIDVALGHVSLDPSVQPPAQSKVSTFDPFTEDSWLRKVERVERKHLGRGGSGPFSRGTDDDEFDSADWALPSNASKMRKHNLARAETRGDTASGEGAADPYRQGRR